jgi:hypothetical protein
MSEDLDKLIAKWDEARRAVEECEARVERYKERIQKHMKQSDLDKYENKEFTVKRQVQSRMTLSKKTVPEDVWTAYARPHTVEFYTLVKKKK